MEKNQKQQSFSKGPENLSETTYHNPGFAFGVLKEKPGLVKYIPLALTSGIFAYWINLLGKEGRNVEKIGTGIALMGATSNTVERLSKGYVVDDISIPYGKDKKKTFFFNRADMCIWAGSLIMLIGNIKEENKKKV